MPLIATVPTSNFKPLPAGSHLATCYQVIDLGTQDTGFVNEDGKPNIAHRILVGWETPDELTDAGDPMVISKEYTLSLHEKATLYSDLVGWRGREFSQQELGGFDIKAILGKSCLLTVIGKQTKKGQTVSVVQSVGQLPKGIKAKPQHHTSIYFEVSEGPQSATFKALPEWIQKKIGQCQEWTKPAGGNITIVSSDERPLPEPDEVEVPF